MSKWKQGTSHQWEMELKAWKALLAISESDHDIAHCVIKIKNRENNLRNIDHIAEVQEYQYEQFSKEWMPIMDRLKEQQRAHQ